MKDETLKAAYNAQTGVEGEYITGAGVSATTNDGAAFKPFLEHLKQTPGRSYKKIVADAGYESEENYAYLEEHQQEAYIKPTNYERMKTGKFKKDVSKRENMAGNSPPFFLMSLRRGPYGGGVILLPCRLKCGILETGAYRENHPKTHHRPPGSPRL